MGRKGVDKGNKRRMIKNLMRFIKHPLAYIYWKTINFNPYFFPKILTLGFFSVIVSMLYEWKSYSTTIQANDALLLQYGKNVEGSQGRMKGYHKGKKLRSPNVFDFFFKSPITANQIILNQTWRQNLRKELQLTNYHNVEF
eukprot:GHVR01023052.1.p1 GENE.GHVR01023052.1~~GHVR01023052.1.p1  ORF type:complete len:141 (+),score=2.05 GHVR01023052.1:208-630(+)